MSLGLNVDGVRGIHKLQSKRHLMSEKCYFRTYTYIICVCKTHQSVFLCTASMVNANYEQMASCDFASFGNHDALVSDAHFFATQHGDQCSNHYAVTHSLNKRTGTSRIEHNTQRTIQSQQGREVFATGLLTPGIGVKIFYGGDMKTGPHALNTSFGRIGWCDGRKRI